MAADQSSYVQWIGLVVGSGFAGKLLHVAMQIRDNIRDHMRDVGHKEPPLGPSGLFRRVDDLEHSVYGDRRFGERRAVADDNEEAG